MAAAAAAAASAASGGGGASVVDGGVAWWRRRWRAAEAVAAHSANRECPRGTTRPPHQHPRHSMQRARCVLRGACCVLPCCGGACSLAASHEPARCIRAGNSPGVNEIDETQPPDWQPYACSCSLIDDDNLIVTAGAEKIVRCCPSITRRAGPRAPRRPQQKRAPPRTP